MVMIGQSWINLMDLYRNSGNENDAAHAEVLEMLHKSNPITDDAIFVECNNGSSHKHRVRTGLPTISWGALYEGTPQSKSNYQFVEDTTGFMEARSGVDERLKDLWGARFAAYRLNEAEGFFEAFRQELAMSMFYADSANEPRKYKGLACRYNKIEAAGAGNQIVDAGGVGTDNTSIWFVTHGTDATHFLYPQNTRAGVQRTDLGRQRLVDDLGNPYEGYEEKYSLHVGCAVRDWRKNARIANIDVSELLTGNVDIYKWLRKAYYKLPVGSRRIHVKGQEYTGRTSIYMSTDVMEAIDALGTNSGSTDNFTRLRMMEIEGKEVLTYRGLPIRETDNLLKTEARVTA